MAQGRCRPSGRSPDLTLLMLRPPRLLASIAALMRRGTGLRPTWPEYTPAPKRTQSWRAVGGGRADDMLAARQRPRGTCGLLGPNPPPRQGGSAPTESAP